MLMLDCHCVALASETSTWPLWRCGENVSSQLYISSKKLIYQPFNYQIQQLELYLCFSRKDKRGKSCCFNAPDVFIQVAHSPENGRAMFKFKLIASRVSGIFSFQCFFAFCENDCVKINNDRDRFGQICCEIQDPMSLNSF